MKLVYLLLILVLVPFVSAIPETPHRFYGSVYDNNDLVNPGFVTAKLCNRQFSTSIINGYYGYSEIFFVTREDCSNTNIEFYVNNQKVRDYTYISGGYTRINLHVPIIETQDNPPTDNNPPADNNPQDTSTNDNSDDGEERDTSHIKPTPDYLFEPINKKEETKDNNENQNVQVNKYSGSITGKTVYDTLTKTKLGIVTITTTGSLSVLGLLFLLFKKIL